MFGIIKVCLIMLALGLLIFAAIAAVLIGIHALSIFNAYLNKREDKIRKKYKLASRAYEDTEIARDFI